MVGANLENIGHGGNRKNQDANLHVDREEAAKLLNVSERSIASAKKVKESGVPELSEKVMAGEVVVSTASDIAELPLLVFSAVEQPPH